MQLDVFNRPTPHCLQSRNRAQYIKGLVLAHPSQQAFTHRLATTDPCQPFNPASHLHLLPREWETVRPHPHVTPPSQPVGVGQPVGSRPRARIATGDLDPVIDSSMGLLRRSASHYRFNNEGEYGRAIDYMVDHCLVGPDYVFSPDPQPQPRAPEHLDLPEQNSHPSIETGIAVRNLKVLAKSKTASPKAILG